MDTTDGCSGDGEEKLVAIEVERVAYAAIGRHLRVMCFLCLLLLVLGFLIGHHVANQHARELARNIERREEGLREQLTLLTGECATLRQSVADSERRSVDLRAQVARNELATSELKSELKEGVESADALRRSLIVEVIEQAESDRRGLMREFKPYVEQNQTLSAEVVANAFTRVIDAQRERLNRLIEVPSRPTCAQEPGSTLPLVPVSESGPSPTFSGSTGSPAAETPVAASTEILLFDAGTPAPAPAPAPPPPVETPIRPAQALAPSTGLTPLPASPAISLGPTVPPIPIVPTAPPQAVSPATPPFEPPVAAATPVAPPAEESTPPAPVETVDPAQAASPSNAPEARKKGAVLFFTPSRKPPTSSVPAIPIGVPASGPSIGTAPQLPLRTAGPQ